MYRGADDDLEMVTSYIICSVAKIALSSSKARQIEGAVCEVFTKAYPH